MRIKTAANVLSAESPLAVFASGWKNRTLVLRLAKREIEARYRGSILGLLWAVITPLLMLGVYTFVFSVIFQARWGQSSGNRAEFSLLLFSGLIIFNLFSETINRAPTLMLENPSYIKKVLFPLEIMPWVAICVSLFNALVAFCLLFLFYPFVFGAPPLSILFLPLLLVPLMLITLGLTWFLSSVGVYLRDIRQVIGVLTTMLLFLSPIFYPVSALPEKFRQLIYFNPLTLMLERSKDVMFWGHSPSILGLALLTLLSWAVAWLGYLWFIKTKKGFADVL